MENNTVKTKCPMCSCEVEVGKSHYCIQVGKVVFPTDIVVTIIPKEG